jgi:hypothetical protein
MAALDVRGATQDKTGGVYRRQGQEESACKRWVRTGVGTINR